MTKSGLAVKLVIAAGVLLASLAAGSCWADAEGDMRRASELLEAGDYGGAIEAFAAGAPEPSRAAEAQCRISATCSSQGKLGEAIEACRKGIGLASEPEDSAYVIEMRRRIADSYFSLRDYDRARMEYQALIVSDPSSAAYGQYMIGACYENQGRHAEAIAASQNGMESGGGPEDARYIAATRRRIADCYFQLEDYKSAAVAYRELISADRDSLAYGLRRIVACYLAEGRPSDAEAVFAEVTGSASPEEIADAGSEIAQCQLEIGRSYHKARDLPRAAAIFRALVDEFPSTEAGWYGIGYTIDVLRDQGRVDDALAFLEKVSEEHANHRQYALFLTGEVLFQNARKYDRAITVLNQFLSEFSERPLAPQWMVVHAKQLLAFALEKRGSVDEAVEIVKALLLEGEAGGETAWLTEWIAETYFRAHRYASAAGAFGDLSRLGAASPEMKAKAAYHVALCHYKQGHTRIAERYMWRVIEQHPDSAWSNAARIQLASWARGDAHGD